MRVNKKKQTSGISVAGAFVIIIIIMIFYLTFQNPEQTVFLSNSVYKYLNRIGIEISEQILRSIIHIPMYFILGLAITLYGITKGIKIRSIYFASILIALTDESVKIILPTREFDIIDLMLDFLGISLAIVFVKMFAAIKVYMEHPHKQ